MADSNDDSTAISVDHDEAGAHRSSGQWPTTEEILGPHDEQPATTFLRKWDIVFTISCVFAVFLDPFYPYITVLDEDRTCYHLDPYLLWPFFGLRSALDLFYFWDTISGQEPFEKSFKARNIQFLRQFVSARGVRVLPIPQFLLPAQYILRIHHTYKRLKWCANIETKIGRSLNAILDFLPFILAAHLYGALWYRLSLQREVDCWRHACHDKRVGCDLAQTAYGFYCGVNITSYKSRLNITHIKASCPINPPDPTIFDFGIYLYALQSNTIRSTSIPRNILQCFWWGLRNLSSLGSNLQTSLYWGEIVFTIFVSISGMVLFLLYLNKRIQVPMLENMNENVLKAICEHLKLVRYSEDKYIFREGEPLDKMLFISQGTAWSYPTNASGSSAIKCLVKGDFYGEELLNWASKLSSFSEFPKSTRVVKAHTKVEAFAIRANNLNIVVSTFWWHFSKKLDHIEDSQLEKWQSLAASSMQAKWRRRMQGRAMGVPGKKNISLKSIL
ncbi:hypothetical protein PRUPE_7G210900 [Prunus persica]|uniref:Cyclic nucleotide-binding domain-containing protein n=2 Tax=Prunus persica TaxID=3760 RepID=A0A251NEP3_PRUPE|nr:hypothetical protein PRUPE_7G210900 [Prunus persica]